MIKNHLNKNDEVNDLLKKNIILYASVMVVIFLNTIIVNAESSYAVYVDPGYGFYKVRDITVPNSSFLYDNKTLVINKGDTIEWINDADDVAVTIVSGQDLFAPINIKVGKHTDYLFDRSGVFEFYIKGYSDKSQTIIVVNPAGGSENVTVSNSTENVITSVPTDIITSVPTSTENTTPVSTETPLATPNSTENLKNNNNGSENQIGNLKLSNVAIPSIIVSIMSIFMFLAGRKGR